MDPSPQIISGEDQCYANMNKSKIEVFGIGQCALDYLGIIDSYPSTNSKCEFTGLVIEGGGPVATSLVALQRWGYNCSFSGVVGDDDYGKKILESIQTEDVDISNVKIRKDTGSQVAFVMAEPNSGNRTIFWRRPTGYDLTFEEIDSHLLSNIRLLHTDGIFPQATVAACKRMQESGIPVSVDAGSMRPGMLEIAQNSNYFIASETFARSFLPNSSPEEVCYKLKERGPDLVAVTLGDRGYIALADGDLIKGQAYKVKTIDTTGCGDLFHAGFNYGILQNWPAEECLDFGAWAAAMVSRYLGGRKGIPDLTEIENFRIERG
jgi:sulfofructose kinase